MIILIVQLRSARLGLAHLRVFYSFVALSKSESMGCFVQTKMNACVCVCALLLFILNGSPEQSILYYANTYIVRQMNIIISHIHFYELWITANEDFFLLLFEAFCNCSKLIQLSPTDKNYQLSTAVTKCKPRSSSSKVCN